MHLFAKLSGCSLDRTGHVASCLVHTFKCVFLARVGTWESLTRLNLVRTVHTDAFCGSFFF